jgi:hypothetical protein
MSQKQVILRFINTKEVSKLNTFAGTYQNILCREEEEYSFS